MPDKKNLAGRPGSSQSNVFAKPQAKPAARPRKKPQAPKREANKTPAKKTPSRNALPRKTSAKAPAKEEMEVWEKELKRGAKVYKLTAYTTTDSINKKFKTELRLSRLKKALITLMLILLVFILLGKFIDWPDSDQIKQVTGQEGVIN